MCSSEWTASASAPAHKHTTITTRLYVWMYVYGMSNIVGNSRFSYLMLTLRSVMHS